MSIKPISDFLDLFEGLNPCKSRMVGSPSPQTESKCIKKKKNLKGKDYMCLKKKPKRRMDMHGAMDGGSGLPLVAVHGGDSAMNGAWRLRNGSDWWIYEVAEEMRVEEMAWAIRRQWGSLPWTVEARRRVVMCSSGRRRGEERWWCERSCGGKGAVGCSRP